MALVHNLGQWHEVHSIREYAERASEKIGLADPVTALEDAAASKAYRAMLICAGDWQQHRAKVREALLEAAKSATLGANEAKIAELIEQLDAEEFKTREDAAERLTTMGKDIEPLLRAALDKADSPEVKSRLSAVMKDLKARTVPPEERRARRLLETAVLAEGMNSPLLEEASKAATNRWLREQIEDLRR